MRFPRVLGSLIARVALVAVVVAVLLFVRLPGGATRVDSTAGFDIRRIETTRRFDAPEAIQAVAVDATHFYAIANTVIGKYDKESGRPAKGWQATEELPLIHLNSGLVRDGLLYCAHSNFPNFPESSSVEVFDVNSMEHVKSHSLGIYEGSLTWIDWHDESWWAVFAHYTKKVNGNPHAKDNRWTTLVRFDSQWRRLAGWTFPQELLDRFEPHSCSGGSWSSDGKLYCTGHDRGELYELALPKATATLRLVNIIEMSITGQGIAFDRACPGVIFGIDRGRRQVVVARL
jgi:hypothetical protein